jgi:hypothetical protein
MDQHCQPQMNSAMYQDFNPNESYGSNNPVVGSQQYYELLNEYNKLLEMYRKHPAVQSVRNKFPRKRLQRHRNQNRIQEIQRLQEGDEPDLWSGAIPNLKKYAARLNVPFNAGDLTNTSDNGYTPSPVEDDKVIQIELGKSTSESKKKKKKKTKKNTKKATSHSGGRSKRSKRSKRNRRTHRIR